MDGLQNATADRCFLSDGRNIIAREGESTNEIAQELMCSSGHQFFYDGGENSIFFIMKIHIAFGYTPHPNEPNL